MSSLTISTKDSIYSPAAKLLIEKPQDSELSGTEAPKSIWETDSEFQEQHLSNFQAITESISRLVYCREKIINFFKFLNDFIITK